MKSFLCCCLSLFSGGYVSFRECILVVSRYFSVHVSFFKKGGKSDDDFFFLFEKSQKSQVVFSFEEFTPEKNMDSWSMWSCGIIIIFRRLEFFIHQRGNWRLADIFQPQKVRVQDFKKNIQRHRPYCRNFCDIFAKVFLCDLFVFSKIVTCDIVRWVIESRASLPFFSSGFDDDTKIGRIFIWGFKFQKWSPGSFWRVRVP